MARFAWRDVRTRRLARHLFMSIIYASAKARKAGKVTVRISVVHDDVHEHDQAWRMIVSADGDTSFFFFWTPDVTFAAFLGACDAFAASPSFGPLLK